MLSKLEKSLFRINLEEKLGKITRKVQKTFKDSLRKENLDLYPGWSICIYSFVSNSPLYAINNFDKIFHGIYGYELGKTGNIVFRNFYEKYEKPKDFWKGIIVGGLPLYLAGSVGKELYDVWIGKKFDIYDILASTVGLGIFIGIELYKKIKLKNNQTGHTPE